MDQLSTTMTEAPDPALSTQLDESRPNQDAQSKTVEEGENAEAKGPESRIEAIKRAAADLEKEAPKKEEPAKAEKVEAPEEVKEPSEEQKAETAKQTEDRARRPVIEPPTKFLPRAKELWHNTPHEVRSEMTRIMAEAESETAAAKESVAEYERVRPFDEMAKRSGTTLDAALGRYVEMEQTLRSNPAQGFKALLDNMGIPVPQAIGHIMAAFNVRPEQLVAHMQNDPNAYTALAPRQQPQQARPQIDPEVASLKQQVAQMQKQTLHATIIEPFARENPRYNELEPHIAQLLKSGMIPDTLSLHDKLAAAYDMAVRLNPSASRQAPTASFEAPEESDSRAGNDFGGTKSVRGAPASGVDTSSRRKGKMSRTEAIAAAAQELGLN